MIRATDSFSTNIADAAMIRDCASAASPSAFPWPKRCSLSAGLSDTVTAKNVIRDPSTSSVESTSELSSDTESVACHAQTLIATRMAAVLTEA